ncbi:substrate-binding domain-containing protein [Streptomyces phaeolivaceus]|uniref:Substrate-binding domain-containing protein n=1 Tax=Streptomyces phaeolivaceus TaxID=2653200 RepID=A0A5P8JXI6_9ACTN|nr:substrate-binding domain-containing protein [Streptomyces phaeolivaceus]QFQ95516.1 substrate-binding domain-containing protein [Streptomyces phaeolivaceus]
MRVGTRHLIDLGHTRIGHLRGEEDLKSTSVRFQGFEDAMRLAGIEVDPRLVASCDFSYACGFRTATRLITEHAPTAIVAGADLTALGAIDAARALGLNVPTDFSVVGFDDLPQAARSFPGLTTVRQPLHDMGQKAARALLSLIEGQKLLMEHLEVATEPVPRDATAPPAPAAGRKATGGENPLAGRGDRC